MICLMHKKHWLKSIDFFEEINYLNYRDLNQPTMDRVMAKDKICKADLPKNRHSRRAYKNCAILWTHFCTMLFSIIFRHNPGLRWLHRFYFCLYLTILKSRWRLMCWSLGLVVSVFLLFMSHENTKTNWNWNSFIQQ